MFRFFLFLRLERHSFVRNIYLLLFTMQQVLRWKYGWTTLGHKIIQITFQVNIFNFLKNYNFKSMAGRFFLFSIHFVNGPTSYRKNYFKILDVNILVKRPLEKLHLHPQLGPDTYNSPHQRGAVSKAEQPLFVQKNHFRNYQKLLNLWLD